jgi:hypothetical protein
MVALLLLQRMPTGDTTVTLENINRWYYGNQRWALATFVESAIAIPQLEGSTSVIAILQLFKEILLRNCNSAIAIFSEVRNLRASLPQFSAYFLCGIVDSLKK